MFRCDENTAERSFHSRFPPSLKIATDMVQNCIAVPTAFLVTVKLDCGPVRPLPFPASVVDQSGHTETQDNPPYMVVLLDTLTHTTGMLRW